MPTLPDILHTVYVHPVDNYVVPVYRGPYSNPLNLNTNR